MDLGNLTEIVVYYLLMGGMICFGCRDEFPMMSALVCVVTYWTILMMNHDTRISNCYDSRSYYVAWTLKDLEMTLSLC